ncbi:hypothetical protein LAZ67_1006544 [Cordylochernes scorpioides]|uniref:Mos1 transposase HTH domain-containing protein n=1 Tax=Cordylochernes scorpioides TaxID=51811 RepID=A0ABY6K0H1_9ARAC|nr:hypothetical protein LAZ67_1006544 [Cordylochernes scorpioides]
MVPSFPLLFRDNLDSLHSISLPFATISSGLPVMPLQYLKSDRDIGAFTLKPCSKKWGDMTSPSVLMTPKKIMGAGNLVCITKGAFEGSLQIQRSFLAFKSGPIQRPFIREEPQNATRTLALMNEDYEDEKLSRTKVYLWYKRFKDGRKSIADDSRSGRPLTSTMDRNIGQVQILEISCGCFQKIIGDNLNVIKLCCYFLKKFNRSKKRNKYTPNSPRWKKVCIDKSKGKVLLVVFSDYQGLVYYEFTRRMARATPGFYPSADMWIYHTADNRVVWNGRFRQPNTLYLFLPHPPYSSDIAPCDFFSFPKLKMTLRGSRFSLSSEVIENATVELNKLIKIDFELAFQQLFSR